MVAAALLREDGRWLMHKRPPQKHHGGLWEFPGGKVEIGENPRLSLRRELGEELGIEIEIAAAEPLFFADDAPGDPVHTAERPIVLMLYKITDWHGEPSSLEGGEVGWFMPTDIAALAKPPLDHALAARLFGEI